jgi:hypothetical protein
MEPLPSSRNFFAGHGIAAFFGVPERIESERSAENLLKTIWIGVT